MRLAAAEAKEGMGAMWKWASKGIQEGIDNIPGLSPEPERGRDYAGESERVSFAGAETVVSPSSPGSAVERDVSDEPGIPAPPANASEDFEGPADNDEHEEMPFAAFLGQDLAVEREAVEREAVDDVDEGDLGKL